MMGLRETGVQIHREVISAEGLESLRREVDRVAQRAGSTCARHIRGYSEVFEELCHSPALLDLLPDGYAPVRSL